MVDFCHFGPIWTKYRSKQLKIWPGSHFLLNRLDPIDPIASIRSHRSDRGDRIDGKNQPFLVRFGQNLGLNNLKFGQESIFAVDSIGSTRSTRSDRIDCKNGLCHRPQMMYYQYIVPNTDRK